jgi:hypothetical protein
MKLDNRTLQILKNFATINDHLVINPGSKIATINKDKTIIAVAEVQSVFEKMAIYEMSKFIRAISLFSEPDLEFHSKYVIIKDSNASVNYTFADSTHLIVPSKTNITMPKTNISFNLTAENLKKALDAIRILGLPEICFIGDGEVVSVSGENTKDSTGHIYKTIVGETDVTFKSVFNVDNFKMLLGDYNVKISSQGIASFSTDDLTYYISPEAKKSTYNE